MAILMNTLMWAINTCADRSRANDSATARLGAPEQRLGASALSHKRQRCPCTVAVCNSADAQ